MLCALLAYERERFVISGGVFARFGHAASKEGADGLSQTSSDGVLADFFVLLRRTTGERGSKSFQKDFL